MQKKFIVIIGISRSGTTLLASLFHVNESIEIRFEPWHTLRQNDIPVFSTIEWFDSFFSGIYGKKLSANVIGFKETLGEIECLNWIKQVLNNFSINNNASIKIVVILRDIAQCYLSNVEALQKYWSEPNRKSTTEKFTICAEGYMWTICEFIELQRLYGGAFVSYKMLTLNPKKTLSDLSKLIDVPYSDSQLEFYRIINKSHVMGDVELATNPQPVSYKKYQNRADQAQKFINIYHNELLNIPGYSAYECLLQLIDNETYLSEIPLNIIKKFETAGYMVEMKS